MNPTPKISVILPVYNVEKWIERAISSLQKQTLRDFEAWLVDDGSTDNSGNICDRIVKNDNRFNVIHQKNSGAATARNNALIKSCGKYIYFMDPDDWCEDDMLLALYDNAESINAQLVITGFYIDTYYNENNYFQEKRTAPNKIFKSKQEFREYSYKLFDAQLLYAPWNKLYLRSYLIDNNIKFPNTFWDDLPFNLDVTRDIERVSCVDKHFYHFLRARNEAENTKYRPDMYKKREEEHTWLVDLYKYWNLNTPEIKEFLARRYTERLIGCVENLTCKDCTLKTNEIKREIKEIISTENAIACLKLTKPKSKMMKLMLIPYNKQNVNLVRLESKVISLTKQKFTRLFAKLKANR
jgi:glycosyltransferase involved in cell wall biosynthesis